MSSLEYTAPVFLPEGCPQYTACMNLRIASWNVRGMPRPADQLRLLAEQQADVVLLQDVGPTAARAVTESHLWSHVFDTWSLRAAATAARRGGCLIATTDDWAPAPLVADGSPLAPRLVAATFTRSGATLTLASCYAPTNTGQGRKERHACFTSLANWLRTVRSPLVLGMDANGPRIDHPDIDQSGWWTPEEALVLGGEAQTADALRLWYADHPAELTRRRRYYPDGPLADSYHRGRKGKFVRCRYDSIRVSPDINVTHVHYLYDKAIQAGSDHALVVAEVTLP